MNKNSMDKAYNAVCVFNEVAGNSDDVSLYKIDRQISYCWEEMCEVIQAFEDQDKEIAKEAADLLYTVFGLVQLLEKRGVNMDEAIRRVCENNATKMIPSKQTIRYPFGWRRVDNEKHQLTVLKNENNKVMKPEGYVATVFEDLVPDDFYKEQEV